MALPPGIVSKTVTVGIASFFDGSLAEGTATITAPVNVVHTPTNRPIFSSQMSHRFVDGETSFNLCPTDAPGLNRVDFAYKLSVVISGALVQPEPVYFLLPSAGPDMIDLDSLVTVPSSAGTPISVDVLTSEQLPAQMATVAADTDSAFAVAQRAAFDAWGGGSGGAGVAWVEEAAGSYPAPPAGAKVIYFLGEADPGEPPAGKLYLHLSTAADGGTVTPPPTSTAVRTFVGTDGAPWPVEWTTTVTGGGIADIQSNRGRLRSTGSYGAEVRAYLTAEPAAAKFDRTFEIVLFDLSEQYQFLGVRCSGTTAQVFPNTGYGVQVAPGTATPFSVTRKQGGSADYLSGSSLAAPAGFAAGVPTKVRIAVDGTDLSAKVWLSSQTEPASWGWSGPDPLAAQYGAPTSGQVYIASGNGAGTTSRPLQVVSVTDNLAA